MKQFLSAICATILSGCVFGVTFAPKAYVDNVISESFTTNNEALVNMIRTLSPRQSLEPSTNYTDKVTVEITNLLNKITVRKADLSRATKVVYRGTEWYDPENETELDKILFYDDVLWRTDWNGGYLILAFMDGEWQGAIEGSEYDVENGRLNLEWWRDPYLALGDYFPGEIHFKSANAQDLYFFYDVDKVVYGNDLPTNHVTTAELQAAISAIPVPEIDTSTLAKTGEVAEVRNIVNSWEGYWGGTNVIFEVTNYYGNTSGEIPRLRVKELRSGVWHTVWDEIDKFTVCETNIMTNVTKVVNAAVNDANEYAKTNCAPLAWGTVTDKGSTNVVGNSVWMTAPETYFAGGTEYQRVAVGSGAICVLVDKGAGAYTTGEEGTFRFQDAGGTNFFGFAKSDSYTIGCRTDGITVESNLVTLRYDVIMGGGDVPIVYWRLALGSGEWVQLNNADGTAADGAPYTVTWYTSGGSYYAAINCGSNASGFFKAETSVAGDIVFETNMKVRLGGGIECTNSLSGAMGIIRPVYNGSTVNWTWSAK